MTAGCASLPSPPPVRPELVTGVLHFAGTPLTGPLAAETSEPLTSESSTAEPLPNESAAPDDVASEADDSAGDAETAPPTPRLADEVLHFGLSWRPGPPPAGGQALAQRARLLLGPGALAPLAAVSRVDPGVRLFEGDEAGAVLNQLAAESGEASAAPLLARHSGLLSDGLTCVFGVAEAGAVAELRGLAEPAEDDTDSGDRRVALASVASGLRIGLTRSGDDRLRPALVLSGRPRPAFAQGVVLGQTALSEPPAANTDDRVREETLLVEDLAVPRDGPLLLAVPWALSGQPEAAFTLYALLVVDEQTPDAAAQQRARRDTELALRLAAAGSSAVSDDEAFRRTILAALSSLRGVPEERPALVFLADATRARLAGDLALVLADAELPELTHALRANVDELDAVAAGQAQVGFRLERAAWRYAIERLLAEDVPPSVPVLLERHAGEAGRYPALLREQLSAARDLPELEQRLVALNREFLEDGQPAPRVRAHDWLRARGLHAPDFDPLAERAERRRRLAAAREAGWGAAESSP